MKNKCLGCHINLEEGLYFCSFTCACLCGYFSVTKGWIKDPATIAQEIKDKFLNNPPLREYDKKYL